MQYNFRQRSRHFYTHLWRKFDNVMLWDVKRQKDETLQNILSTVRMGETNDEINSIPQARLRPHNIYDTKGINSDDVGAAIIYSLRKERDVWNKRFLERIDVESHKFEAEDNDATGNPLSENDKRRIKFVHRDRLDIENRCNSCPMQEHRHGTWLVEWHNSKR